MTGKGQSVGEEVGLGSSAGPEGIGGIQRE